MPVVEGTSARWTTWAKRWRKVNPDRPAAALSRVERLQSLHARAAFWQASAKAAPEGLPPPSACLRCGLNTYSWCEGCYHRVHGDAAKTFYAICQECDAEKKVCDACQMQSISWSDGHATFLQSRGEHCDDEDCVEISCPSGTGTVHTTLTQLAAETGQSVEAVRRALAREIEEQRGRF